MQQRRQLEREFFHGAAVRLVWDVSQEVLDGRLRIGGRAGPVMHIANLCHEMAHFVEIDDSRCGVLGWGLRIRKIWVIDQLCIEPLTHQGTDRECRVAAYQLNLMRHLGLRATPEKLVRPFHYQADWWNVPGGPGDKGRLRWCADQVKALSDKPEYQIDAFTREWWRKNHVLAHRYEALAQRYGS